jgi:hypothetical protein
MKKWQIALKNFLSPLPNPQTLVNQYWTLDLPHLTGHQIKLLIQIIIDEAKISRGFGLFLRPDDLNQEILFWLVFINNIGPNTIRHLDTDQKYQEFWNTTYTLQIAFFQEAINYYFNLITNSKPRLTPSALAFQCHLQAVQSHIFRTIIDNQFPLA